MVNQSPASDAVTPISDTGITGVFAPGQRVGRYEICSRLATGGMATIYLARFEGPGGFKKLVALKCIHPHLTTQPGFVEMFLDEARLASRINHPNVIEVFDFGFADGVYFMVMPLLDGEALSRITKRLGPFGEQDAPTRAACLRVIADVAAGLHAIHEARDDDGQPLGAVHRDVTPANVFVTFEGAVKVLDLGIARVMDQLHHTNTGTLKGTLAYMAPEQMSQALVDRRADIWSLGVVAWETLSGQRLFRRATEIQTMRAVMEESIPPLPEICPDLPAGLADLVSRCLRRDPAARPPSCAAFADVIAALSRQQQWVLTPSELGAWLQDRFAAERVAQRKRAEDARNLTTSPKRDASAQPPAAVDHETRAANAVTARRSSTAARMAFATIAAIVIAFGAWWTLRPADEPRLPDPLPAPTEIARPDGRIPPRKAEPPTSQVEPPREAETAPPDARVRRRAPSRPAAAAPGYVNIATPGGWADVYLRATRLGRTPLQVKLPAGRNRLVLRPFSRGRVTKEVVVTANETQRLVVPVGPP